MYSGLSPAGATPVTSGLSLWLDASDASTFTLSGSTVTEWRDKNGSSAKMTTSAGTPTRETFGINSLPTVRLNASSRMNDGVNHSSPVTIFYVSRQTGGSNGRVLTSAGNNWLLGYWGGLKRSAWFDGNVNLNGVGTVPADTAPNLFTATIPGSGQNSTYWAEGIQLASNQGGTAGPNNLQFNGLSSGGGNEPSDCEISEVLVYRRILNPIELDAVGGYLAEKYGLTTNYPTELGVTVTSPVNNAAILTGTSISATATVVSGVAPYTVQFFTRSLPGGTFTQAGANITSPPYTLDIGTLSNGNYEIYATVTDSAGTPATATSKTNTFTVAGATATTTTVTTSGSPSVYGDSVTFTATVSPIPSGGTVQFYHPTGLIGRPVTINTTTGQASVTTTTLDVATHDIDAVFSGFQIHEPSDSNVIQQVVNKATLTVTAHSKVRGIGYTNPPLTAQFTGFKNEQNLATSGVSGEAIVTCNALPSDPLGSYPIACGVGTLVANNYNFITAPGTLTIVPITAVMAYEGFDYAAGVIAGQNGGTGFSGVWSNLETSSTGVTVKADGLAFSNLLVTGGRIEGQATAGGGKTRVQRNLSVSNSGQTYGAYLYRRNSTIDETTVAGLMIGAPNENDNDSTISVYGDEWFQNIGARAEDNMGIWSGSAITSGETFLVLFSAQLNHGLQTVTMWVLSDDQFDIFKSGGITESELNDANVGSGTSEVWAKSTATGMDDSLDMTNNLKFMAYGGFGPSEGILVSFDELRLSQTSLTEVVPLKPSITFANWASANAPGQTPNQDHDNDGVKNGIEYFMGATGSSLTTLPSLNSSNTITWPASEAFIGTYEVQTSSDLTAWINVNPRPTRSAGTLSYTLPPGASGGKNFVRLLVTPTQ